jgi:hypothetical protein
MCVCDVKKIFLKKTKKSVRHSADSFVCDAVCVCGDVKTYTFQQKGGGVPGAGGADTQKPHAPRALLCARAVCVCEARVGRGKCIMHERERGVRGGGDH